MTKAKLNAWVNIFSFLSFLFSSVTGLVLWFGLPYGLDFRGSRLGLKTYNLLGLERHYWKDLHNYSSLALVFLVVIHLVLHWQYIKGLTKLIKEKKSARL